MNELSAVQIENKLLLFFFFFDNKNKLWLSNGNGRGEGTRNWSKYAPITSSHN